MNFTDERLARLKHATRMAVTRQDAHPAWGPALTGAPLTPPYPALLTPPLPGAPGAGAQGGRVRRVPARLIALPGAAHPAPGWSGPSWAGTAPAEQRWPEQTSAEQARGTPGAPAFTGPPVAPAPLLPGPAPLDAPAPVSGQRGEWPTQPAAAPTTLRPTPYVQPSVPPTIQPAPSTWDPPGTAEFTPAAADPYGNHAALLAAGLSETPPPGLPSLVAGRPADRSAVPTTGASEPAGQLVPRDLEARPLRAASFMEALALNVEADAPNPTPGRPRATEVSSVTSAPNDRRGAPVPPLPEVNSASQPTPAQPTPGPATPTAPQPAATQERAPVLPRPAAETLRSGNQSAGPADAGRTAPPLGGAPEVSPRVTRPRADQEPGAPVSPPPDGTPQSPSAAAPTSEPTLASPEVNTPRADSTTDIRRPDPVTSDDRAAGGRAADNGTTSDRAADSNASTTSAVDDRAADEIQVAEQLQAQRDAQARERQELEALMRGGNNDIPVRLPRRPRPVPLRAPAPPPEPEEVKVAPPIPTDVSQNILARLNRFAELEAAGETDESAIPFGQLENWQDHHPERNVTPTAAPAEALSAAPTPRLDPAPPAPGGSTRVRARSRQGREPQAARQAPADGDEEPERGPRPDAAPDAPATADEPAGPADEPLYAAAGTPRPTHASVVPVTAPADDTPATGRPGRAGADHAPLTNPTQPLNPVADMSDVVGPAPDAFSAPERTAQVSSPLEPAPSARPAANRQTLQAGFGAEVNLTAVTQALSRATAPVQTPMPAQSRVDGQPPAPVQTTDTVGHSPDAAPSRPSPVQSEPVRPDAALPASLPLPAVALPGAPTTPTRTTPMLPARPPTDVALSPDPAGQSAPTTSVVQPTVEASVPAADAPSPGPDTTGIRSWSTSRPGLQVSRPNEPAHLALTGGEGAGRTTPPTGPGAPVMVRGVPTQAGQLVPMPEPGHEATLPPTLPVAARLNVGGMDVQAAARTPTPERDGTRQLIRTVPARTVRAPARPIAAPQDMPRPSPTRTRPAPVAAAPTTPAQVMTARAAPSLAASDPTDGRRTAPTPIPVPVLPASEDLQELAPDQTTGVREIRPDAGPPHPVPGRPTVPVAPADRIASTGVTPRPTAGPGPADPLTGVDTAGPPTAPPGVEADGRAVTAAPVPAGWPAPGPDWPTSPTVPAPPPGPDTVPASRPAGVTFPPPVRGRMPARASVTAPAAPGSWTASPPWTTGPAPGVPVPVPTGAAPVSLPVPVPVGPLSSPGGWGAALQRAVLAAPLMPLPAGPTPPPLTLPTPQPEWLPETGVPGPGPEAGRHAPVTGTSPLDLTSTRPAHPVPAIATPPGPATIPGTPLMPATQDALPVPQVPVRSPVQTVRVRPDAEFGWPTAPTPWPAEGLNTDLRHAAHGRLPQPQAALPAGLPDAASTWAAEPPDGGARLLLRHATRAAEATLTPVLPAPAASPDFSFPDGVTGPPLPVSPVRPAAPRTWPAASRPGATPAGGAKPLRTGLVPARPTATNRAERSVLEALDHALQRDGHGTPLWPGEQDALRQVLGSSVADVRVVRRPEIAAALRAARADGLTVGETVFLPHDVPLGSRAGLALAAHEVTHARRAREPLFVPAALTRPVAEGRPGTIPLPSRPSAGDEEGVALATEHAAFAQADPARQSRVNTPRRAPGLPAPWEPLPAWDAPDPPARPSVSADAWGPAVPSAPGPVHAAPAPLHAPPPPATTPLWHAAATDRAPAPVAKAARPPEDQAVGRRAQPRSSVDLDQVAREVYARLRERLSQELRRLN
ncbi:DUF4157 domain-containing protein [Deinococcus soli (ex Cha et al. 2016)]|uniref:Uncharacterized protein n=2 Tax=Deinococcus soli (ex Cha et al. 2016) TaxID=1309411 RepID=A0ACC6KES1_9DEIO|nr:DUF4157 domain-containing protein [Deinococcus soli (ex Cha et al. 2016)]MDR6217952.1 hypothetical protein [Deinococcus soli (ex Cha et al. 2016)]MDR6328202.1 hypothetical protein [Deinococcus soli (ex Cha et al. 2016)]MDR6751054.1 hypothetical protein [Deinococcus soli (ex Cha et al. 2016)]